MIFTACSGKASNDLSKGPSDTARANLEAALAEVYTLPYPVDAAGLAPFPASEGTLKDWMSQRTGARFAPGAYDAFYTTHLVEQPFLALWDAGCATRPALAYFEPETDDRAAFAFTLEIEPPDGASQSLTLAGTVQWNAEGLLYQARLDTEAVRALRAAIDGIVGVQPPP